MKVFDLYYVCKLFPRVKSHCKTHELIRDKLNRFKDEPWYEAIKHVRLTPSRKDRPCNSQRTHVIYGASNFKALVKALDIQAVIVAYEAEIDKSCFEVVHHFKGLKAAAVAISPNKPATPPVSMDVIKVDENGRVNARCLHAFLEVGTKFADWIKNRLSNPRFLLGKDYLHETVISEMGGVQTEYKISLDMAKHFCMLEKNAKGNMARDYYIDCENRLEKVTMVTESHPIDKKIDGLVTATQNLVNAMAQILPKIVGVETMQTDLKALKEQQDNYYKFGPSILEQASEPLAPHLIHWREILNYPQLSGMGVQPAKELVKTGLDQMKAELVEYPRLDALDSGKIVFPSFPKREDVPKAIQIGKKHCYKLKETQTRFYISNSLWEDKHTFVIDKRQYDKDLKVFEAWKDVIVS